MQAGLHHSLPEAVSSAYRLNGISGFYVGYRATLMREVSPASSSCLLKARQIPFSFIQFPIYERMKQEITKFRNGQPPASYEAALCGSISGAFSAALTTPLDVLKTRLMLASPSTSQPVDPLPSLFSHISPPPLPQSVGTIQGLCLLYREGGMRTLFAGVEPRVMWIGIGGFFFFGAFEKVKSLLTKDEF
jgi:solute carrier family 25 (mitochondrial S-adenosylmethionine transporter), member 26